MNIEMNISVGAELLFMLLVAHALADFGLQSEIMRKLKNRHKKPDWIPDGQKYVPCWFYWLTAHSLIHAGLVLCVTQSLACAIFELALHWIIDYAKCEGCSTPPEDQLMHIICKIGYWLALILP